MCVVYSYYILCKNRLISYDVGRHLCRLNTKHVLRLTVINAEPTEVIHNKFMIIFFNFIKF